MQPHVHPGGVLHQLIRAIQLFGQLLAGGQAAVHVQQFEQIHDGDAPVELLRTGQVEINGGPFNIYAPFGGYKQSGNGRELGKYGLEDFLELKAMQFKPPPKAA